MLPFHTIEAWLQRTPAPLQDIVLELRNIIAAVAPDAVEIIRWGDLGYFHASGGLISAGICQIELRPGHIRLAFIQGAFLPDPQQLLRGSRKAKRFLQLDCYEEAPWQALRELITASAHLDPRSLNAQPD